MKHQRLYEKLICQKLSGLAIPDTRRLWDGMQAILNAEMPEPNKPERRGGRRRLRFATLLMASLLVGAGPYTCKYLRVKNRL
jgi:hypothetical protein